MFWLRVIYVVVVLALAAGNSFAVFKTSQHEKAIGGFGSRLQAIEGWNRNRRIRDDVGLADLNEDQDVGLLILQLRHRVEQLEQAAGHRPQEQ